MRSSLALVFALLGCPAPSGPSRPDSGPPPPKVAHVVVLGNERGRLVERAPGLAAQLEREAPAPHRLALSIGSTFSGTDLATVFEGTPTAEAMKALSVAALTPSASDLDFGARRLATLRDTSGAALLLSTVRDTAGVLGPSSPAR